MEASTETKLPAAVVWQAWEKAHALHSGTPIEAGKSAKSSKFKYRIIDAKPGVSFSILWKSLFVRMVFTHSVEPLKKGSKICYAARIEGIFAWPVRWMLRGKIQKNLSFVLKEFVKNLEKQIKA